MPQLIAPTATRRALSRPLDGSLAMAVAIDRSRQATEAIAADPANFDLAIELMETVVARFRVAFLCQGHAEAEAALAYHDRALAEIEQEYTPMYYRRAVLENVAARYERASTMVTRALA